MASFTGIWSSCRASFSVGVSNRTIGRRTRGIGDGRSTKLQACIALRRQGQLGVTSCARRRCRGNLDYTIADNFNRGRGQRSGRQVWLQLAAEIEAQGCIGCGVHLGQCRRCSRSHGSVLVGVASSYHRDKTKNHNESQDRVVGPWPLCSIGATSTGGADLRYCFSCRALCHG